MGPDRQTFLSFLGRALFRLLAWACRCVSLPLPGSISLRLASLRCAFARFVFRFLEQGWNHCKSSPPLPRLWHWAAASRAAHVLSTVRAEVRVTKQHSQNGVTNTKLSHCNRKGCHTMFSGCHAATCPHYSHCCSTIVYLRIYIRAAATRRYCGSLHCTYSLASLTSSLSLHGGPHRACALLLWTITFSGALRVLTASFWQAISTCCIRHSITIIRNGWCHIVVCIHRIVRLRIGLRIDTRILGVGRWGGSGGCFSFFVLFFFFSFSFIKNKFKNKPPDV